MHVVIIGGGIAGLSTAWFLNEQGVEVTVVDKSDLQDNTSHGNAGLLALSHFIPLAAPGTLGKGIRWMFNSRSPFSIRPHLDPMVIQWGLRFQQASNRAHEERSAVPMKDLLFFNKKILQDWQKSLDFQLECNGCAMYYRSAKAEKEELEVAEKAEALGYKISRLSQSEIQTMEPHFKPDVLGAILYEDDAHLYPNALMQGLLTTLKSRGVRILTESTVQSFEKSEGKIHSVRLDSGEELRADVFVLAAGAWSPALAKLAGERMFLMPGKGYSMTMPTEGRQMNYPCILVEDKVAITPWANRIRIGNTMEIGPINSRIYKGRVQGMLESVTRYLPEMGNYPAYQSMLNLAHSKEAHPAGIWFGFRPVSHDGLPYIGWAKQTKNLLINTGHGMLGISMGAGSGKLIAEMALGQTESLDTAVFDPKR